MANFTVPVVVNVDIDTVLKELKKYDLVEVVRCGDCRFHEAEQPGMVYCPAVVGGWVEIDWFCKGGERRT